MQKSFTSSKFEIVRLPELPPLAWCARVKSGQCTALLYCGTMVEVYSDKFAAGAWSAPYEDVPADMAVTLMGSAGRISDDGFVFAAPSHTLEWLQFVRLDNEIVISNSLPMLLAEIEDGPDLTYPNYFFDLLETFRAGLAKPPRTFRTLKNRTVEFIVARNFHVSRKLSLSIKDEPTTVEPSGYEAFRDTLQESVNQLVANARSSSRQYPFNPLVTVSRGYDSVAAAALASNAGCRDAVTFDGSGGPYGSGVDDGTRICEELGLNVSQYARGDLKLLQDRNETSFYINPYSGADKCFLLFKDRLPGTLLMTGMEGDRVWSMGRGIHQPLLQQSQAKHMDGTSLVEFGLQTGFLHFPVPASVAYHVPKLAQISRAPEMSDWRIGGNYDRPIPRRIAEESGVPRDAFGWHKHGGVGTYGSRALSESNRKDLEEFLIEIRSYMPKYRGWLVRNMPTSIRKSLKQGEYRLRTGSPMERRIGKMFGNRLHPRWCNQRSYDFHWGLIRTIQNYITVLRDFRPKI